MISIKITKSWKKMLIRRYGPDGATASIKHRMRQAFTFVGMYCQALNNARILELKQKKIDENRKLISKSISPSLISIITDDQVINKSND